MIDFTTVSREFRSLVSRRRGLITFLGSIFAALGIFLQNVLQGNLPPSLKSFENYAFASYAVLLLVPSLILSLRIAKLHGGMVLNGILYARLMQTQEFTRKGDPNRAARHNFLGVSFLIFLLVDLIAGFSSALLVLALGFSPAPAAAAGLAIVILWLLFYFHFHRQAARFALKKTFADHCAPFDRNEWEAHVAGSLEDTNHDMIGIIAFVGLIVFSVFESLSGLGQVRVLRADLASADIQQHGPTLYAVLMLVTSLMGMVTYIRLRVAVGNFSLQIDPSDRPFRPFRLTDSLLGYMLLAFLLAISLHVLLFPALERQLQLLVGLDAAVFLLALAAEQITLVVAARRYQ